MPASALEEPTDTNAMPIAHINIGSNLGDSRSLIERAVAEIALLSAAPLRRSAFIESEPWGYSSPNGFLNIGVEIETALPPQELLKPLLAIQNAISPLSHRTHAGTYADRLIDIDLIYYGNEVLDLPATSALPALIIPHPRLHLRTFVLRPIAELSPSWRHPLLHLTAAEMLERPDLPILPPTNRP